MSGRQKFLKSYNIVVIDVLFSSGQNRAENEFALFLNFPDSLDRQETEE